MKPQTTSPSYLIRNPYSYCFRMIVPADLQKLVGKTELRYSLKTGSLRVAKHKARFLAGQVQFIFNKLRRGDVISNRLSDDQIQELVKQYVKQSIEGWDRDFYEEWPDDHPGFTPFEALDFFDDIRNQLICRLNEGDFKMLEQPIGELLKRSGIKDVDKDSIEYRKLCAEVHKAEIQLMPMHKKHMLCDFSYKEDLPKHFPEIFPRINQMGSGVIQQAQTSVTSSTTPWWPSDSIGGLMLLPILKKTFTQFRPYPDHVLRWDRPVLMK